MSIGDFLRDQASNQLDHGKKAIGDSAWVDSLVGKLRTATDNSGFDDIARNASHAAIDSVAANKDKISGMGAEAFSLFVHQISSGQDKEAAGTYVRATGSADDLIAAMDRGTMGLIDAKKELDKRWDEAWELVKDIALAGAKQLLPLLLL